MGLGSDSAHVLVLDEPTATLPDMEVEHLHGMLRTAASSGVAILYVTHHLDEVFRLAQSVSVLRDGFLVASGPVGETDRNSLVRSLVGSELEAVHRDQNITTGHDAKRASVLSVEDLRSGLIKGLSLRVAPGEIVGFAGVTGSGRESALGAIFGSVPRQGGEVRIASTVLPPFDPSASTAAGVAYVPPDRKISGAFLHLTAAENLTIGDLKPVWRRMWLHVKEEASQARDWFARLSVRPQDAIQQEFVTFSGGNQQKIIFGKWLRTDPLVLLLDEPTQGVDVGAKAEIHRQIISACEGGLAVVISTSDTEELAALCDRILFMHGGQVFDELSGGNITDVDINRRFLELVSNKNQGGT
jgi:ribose transport system ATP-binding protein